jgi:hypothetical protein
MPTRFHRELREDESLFSRQLLLTITLDTAGEIVHNATEDVTGDGDLLRLSPIGDHEAETRTLRRAVVERIEALEPIIGREARIRLDDAVSDYAAGLRMEAAARMVFAAQAIMEQWPSLFVVPGGHVLTDARHEAGVPA